MKAVNQMIGIVFVVAGIFVLLITSVEMAAYGDFNYYQKEYEKYQVIEDLDMEMTDVMYVTREMMAYLKGERSELSVYTTIAGTEQDFFNEQDRIHMADVQRLFIGGMRLRTAALVVLVLCIGILLVTRTRWGRMLCRTFWIGLGVFFAALGVLAYLFSQNFNKYFTIFHELFFDNDLWIFDPAEDYMIRMLPEGFFYDMAARIVMIFGAGLILLLIISIIFDRKIVSPYKER